VKVGFLFLIFNFWTSYWISEMGFAYYWLLVLCFFCLRCMEVILDVVMGIPLLDS
jgi:hypothetical protein